MPKISIPDPSLLKEIMKKRFDEIEYLKPRQVAPLLHRAKLIEMSYDMVEFDIRRIQARVHSKYKAFFIHDTMLYNRKLKELEALIEEMREIEGKVMGMSPWTKEMSDIYKEAYEEWESEKALKQRPAPIMNPVLKRRRKEKRRTVTGLFCCCFPFLIWRRQS